MKTPLFAVAALFATATLLPAQQDAPPVDVDALLKSLDTVGTANEAASRQQVDQFLREINQASGGRGTEFYEKAIRATLFAGLAQQAADFQAWKKKQGDKLRSNEFQQALQLHLRYLSLSIRFATGTSAKDLLPELTSYTHDVYTAKPAVLGEELMRKAVSDSVFVKWYGLGHSLKGVKGWEMVPVSADGIWEKTILPAMRQEKNPAIVQYWDERLKREAALAGEQRLDIAADQFDNITRPELLWRRAEELAILGSPNKATNEMLALIKNFPTHPNNVSWIRTLKERLTPSKEGK